MTQISFAQKSTAAETATVDAAQATDAAAARAQGAKAYKDLKAKGATEAAIAVKGGTAETAANVADGFLRASYTFNKYKTTEQAEGPTDVTVVTQSSVQAAKAFETLRSTTESMFWASDLANEPANILNPETYAAQIREELQPLGIKVTVIDNDQMKSLGMGAATAVGQGSATPPRMVVMEYDGTNGAQKQPLALVGKGVTFDTGGISLKPGAGMDDMTMDMGGSAAVVGAMRALASRKSASNVVAIVGLAENMPDKDSYRPGDIVTSMAGKTIHIGNTDAEGRLVLADAMTYIQQNYNPHTVVDLATLTGAAVAALGKEFAAVFTNSDDLCAKFSQASAASGEKIWRMPLTETEAFKKAVEATPHADITNMPGPPGASTAAAFLREFVEKKKDGSDKRDFMHIDMAGPGIPGKELKGWGVLLLNQLVADHYEQKPAKAKASAKKAPKP